MCLQTSHRVGSPELNPVDYGWDKNEATKSINPVMLPKSIKLTPPEVLQLIKCFCRSESPCVVVTVLDFPVPSFVHVKGMFYVLINRQSILNL